MFSKLQDLLSGHLGYPSKKIKLNFNESKHSCFPIKDNSSHPGIVSALDPDFLSDLSNKPCSKYSDVSGRFLPKMELFNTSYVAC